MHDLYSLLRPPYLNLILGLISFSAAMVWTCTGKAWIRFHGWVYRAEEPNRFWLEVVAYYLIAAVFIGVFLHRVYGNSG
jgi:hypothetical protein